MHGAHLIVLVLIFVNVSPSSLFYKCMVLLVELEVRDCFLNVDHHKHADTASSGKDVSFEGREDTDGVKVPGKSCGGKIAHP